MLRKKGYFNNMQNKKYKKLSSALFQDDKIIKQLTDKLIDKELKDSWAITRPFKKLYFNAIRNDDNIVKGLKNLAPAYIDRAKSNIADIIGSSYANDLSNRELNDKLNIFKNLIKSYYNEDAKQFLKDDALNFLNKNKDNLVNATKQYLMPSIQGAKVNLRDLFKKINKGYFNNKENVNRFIKSLDTPSIKVENPLYGLVSKNVVKNKLNEIDDSISNAFLNRAIK